MKQTRLATIIGSVLLFAISFAYSATITIEQGDTLYVDCPLPDSCFIIIKAVRSHTSFEPQGFDLSQSVSDKDWFQYQTPALYSHNTTTSDTLILRAYIDMGYNPKPYEKSTLEIVGAGYYGLGRITIIAVPHAPEDMCRKEGDPMHPYKGDMFIDENDISLGGRGLSVNFSRQYTSMPAESPATSGLLAWTLPLGYGWTHSYNSFLTFEGGYPYATANWSVKQRDGKRSMHYGNWDSGTFGVSSGIHMDMQRSISGADTLVINKEADGKTYYYKKFTKQSLRLDSIKDINGNVIKLTYTSNNLTRITDPTNRNINITYSGNKIQKLYEPPDTTAPYLLFAYETSGGKDRLIRVEKHTKTVPDTTIVLDKYIYNSAHLLISMTKPYGKYTENNDTLRSRKKGDRVNFWYDAKRRLKYEEVVLGDGDTLLNNDIVTYRAQFRYFAGSDSVLDSTAIYYYESGAVTGARDPLTDTIPSLPTTSYYRKVYHYNTDGTVAKEMLHYPATGDTFATSYAMYDSDFNPHYKTDPNGGETRYNYVTYLDSLGNTRSLPMPDSTIYPSGDTAYTYYSAKNNNRMFFRPDSSFDELRNKMIYLYDATGNDTAVIYKDRILSDGDNSQHDVTTTYHINSRGNVTDYLDPLGNKTILHFADGDTGALLTEQRIDMPSSGEGNEDIVTKYGYNGNKLTMDTLTYYRDYPNNPSQVLYCYDVFKRPYRITQPDSSYDSLIYDKRGNILEKYTIKSSVILQKAIYAYDAMDKLIKVKEYKLPQDSPDVYDSTQYSYNLTGRLLSLTNALDKTTNYTYALDRLVKVGYPNNAFDSMGYWPNGLIKFKRDRNGRVIEYSYDGSCMCSSRYRLVKKRYFANFSDYSGNSPADSVVYDYDAVGNRTMMIDSLGTTQYTYDEMNRLRTDSCGYLNTKIIYQYDLAGNRTKMKVTQGDDTTNVYLEQTYSGYDAANRLGRTTADGDTFDFTYWDTGTPKELQYPNGAIESYGLTVRGYVDSIMTTDSSSNLWFKNRYGYNGLGDRTWQYMYQYRPGASNLSDTVSYSYDGLRRLIQTRYPSSINGGDTVTYVYDAMGNRLEKQSIINGTTGYAIDNETNRMTQASIYYMNYDSCGNWYNQWHNMDDPVLDKTMTYDYENRLRKVQGARGNPPGYMSVLYNGDGVRLEKTTNSDTEKRYIVDGMNTVVEQETDGDVRYKYIYANGMLLSRIDNSGPKAYYHRDGLGTIVGMSNTTPEVATAMLFDDFGNWLYWDANWDYYTYTGQEYDWPLMDAYNLRAREYYPEYGRFMQEDPMGNSGGSLNWYLYVANNPINYLDPLGLHRIYYYGPGMTIVDDNEGFLAWLPASSGRNECFCNPNYQNISGKGPIPSGGYSFDPKNFSKGGFWRNLFGDWGTWRVPLTPDPTTNVYGRGGFFIHGGKIPGSAGCIDLGKFDNAFYNLFKDHLGPVPVVVDYF